MDVARQFQVMGHRQLALQEGLALLQELRAELARIRTTGNFFGTTAVLANAIIIPLNVIVNGMGMAKARSAYQLLVQYVYGQVAKSGTRLDKTSQTALESLKLAIIEQLKQKGMKDMIPGVNILVGLTEDSLAAFQVVRMVEEGKRDMHGAAAALDARIVAALRELRQLGIKRAELLLILQRHASTA